MTINTKNVPSSGGPRQEPLEADTYPGRVVQILDLGLQPQMPWKGQEKAPANKIYVTYELVSEFCKDENGEEDVERPRWISEEFVLFNLGAERAKSTQRYNALDPEGLAEGDFAALITAPCAVTVVQNPKKGDPTIVYNNVGDVSSPMKGFDVPELVNEAKVFTLDDPDMSVFNTLPDFLKAKIISNLNFQGSSLQELIETQEKEGVSPINTEETSHASSQEATDDNPW